MNNEEITNKQLFGALSKPLRLGLSAALTMTGISLFTIVGLVAKIADLSSSQDLLTIPKGWFVATVVVCCAFVVFLLVLALLSTFSLVRLKVNFLSINDCIKNIENATNLLSSENQKASMSKHILNGDEISEIEHHVVGEARIVVMTSRFYLDKGKLLDIILNNIRKGVIYEYLIPQEGAYQRDFQKVYQGWWHMFLESISSKEEPGITFSKEYKELQRIKTDNHRLFTKKAKEYFRKHVKELLINKEHSLVTIIMYQQEPQPSDRWEVIMKLPTVTEDNEYYAFHIGDEERVEKTNLVNSIENLCVNANEADLNLDC